MSRGPKYYQVMSYVSFCVYYIHTIQSLPSGGTETSIVRVAMGVRQNPAESPSKFTTSIKAHGGVTMEIAIAQFWMALGDCVASLDVKFFGGLIPSEVGSPVTCLVMFGHVSLQLIHPKL